MTRIHADELRPGDVVACGGERHRIPHVDRGAGWAFRSPVTTTAGPWPSATG